MTKIATPPSSRAETAKLLIFSGRQKNNWLLLEYFRSIEFSFGRMSPQVISFSHLFRKKKHWEFDCDRFSTGQTHALPAAEPTRKRRRPVQPTQTRPLDTDALHKCTFYLLSTFSHFSWSTNYNWCHIQKERCKPLRRSCDTTVRLPMA